MKCVGQKCGGADLSRQIIIYYYRIDHPRGDRHHQSSKTRAVIRWNCAYAICFLSTMQATFSYLLYIYGREHGETGVHPSDDSVLHCSSYLRRCWNGLHVRVIYVGHSRP
jgi:hypothetical protein